MSRSFHYRIGPTRLVRHVIQTPPASQKPTLPATTATTPRPDLLAQRLLDAAGFIEASDGFMAQGRPEPAFNNRRSALRVYREVFDWPEAPRGSLTIKISDVEMDLQNLANRILNGKYEETAQLQKGADEAFNQWNFAEAFKKGGELVQIYQDVQAKYADYLDVSLKPDQTPPSKIIQQNISYYQGRVAGWQSLRGAAANNFRRFFSNERQEEWRGDSLGIISSRLAEALLWALLLKKDPEGLLDWFGSALIRGSELFEEKQAVLGHGRGFDFPIDSAKNIELLILTSLIFSLRTDLIAHVRTANFDFETHDFLKVTEIHGINKALFRTFLKIFEASSSWPEISQLADLILK